MTRSIFLPFEEVKRHLIQRFERDLKIRVLRQPSSMTCWAACYKMVDDWKGKEHSICYYVRLQTGDCGGCSKPQAGCNQVRLPTAILPDWKRLGYAGTSHFETSLNLMQIRNAIKRKEPIQAYISFRGKSEPHCILIHGTSRGIFADTTLMIADPRNDDVVELEFSKLGQWGDWQQSWTVAP